MERTYSQSPSPTMFSIFLNLVALESVGAPDSQSIVHIRQPRLRRRRERERARPPKESDISDECWGRGRRFHISVYTLPCTLLSI